MLRTTLRTTLLWAPVARSIRLSSSNSSSSAKPPSQAKQDALEREKENNSAGEKKKTMAQMDEELMRKMSGLAGDGGEAGVEMEDGQPVSMKRSVKNNMFRYI